MDISQAKEQIKQCVQIYLSKDEFGTYRMPVERQRPVFLLGAPGIGKTAIMEQIAEELSLPLVTYSMTHHTRQSALGLPVIQSRTYQGESLSITEYTLSEIIAALYETMEQTGKKEGILFLDEINCVSETLAPTMLQFLQFKTFGNHKIPQGWVIVTAGNPPQYNRSVREFDIVTLDRLKVMKIEPEYEAFRRYAKAKGLHPAVQAYLDLNKDDFYILETTKNGKQYVTARGWEDLAEAIALYEEHGFMVDESLVGQYLRHERLCMQFSAYYRLFRRYREDYGIRSVLDGTPGDAAARFSKAGIDEKIAVTQLLSGTVAAGIREVQDKTEGLLLIRDILREIKDQSECTGLDLAADGSLKKEQTPFAKLLEQRRLHEKDSKGGKYLAAFTDQAAQAGTGGKEPDLTGLTSLYGEWAEQVKKEIRECAESLERAFSFLEDAGTSNEMLIFVTELTVNEKCSRFLFSHPSPGYTRNSSLLALGERENQLLQKVKELEDE